MPVINGVYLKDFTALPGAVADANIIPIAIAGNQVAYRTTVGGIITDARITGKLLTGLSITGSAILATDTILEAFGKVQNQLNNRVSSVGLTMPSAFSVANSPVTGSGTLAVTANGLASQYIRGDGQLADFPTGGGGGGSSVSYYLNGSVNQGTFGGNTYYEMNKTPIFGAGTDFSIAADGYIAQFITDANDPNSLLIPAGNWNFETYFSASSSGGTPSFYVELYKYSGTTFTLIASNSATPELIAFGTTINPYFSALAVPETVLLSTDRLAIRVYVVNSGRTITLHTENSHLCQIITTFTTGLQSLNGLTSQTQYFAVGTSGSNFNISSSVDTHTFNLPNASSINRGALTTADWITFNAKVGGSGTTNYIPKFTASGTIGDSNIRQLSSSILINKPTGTSDYIFEVVGDSKFNGNGVFTENLQANENVNLSIDSGFSTIIGTGSVTSNKLQVYGNASVSGGNLLVGTTTDAGYKLDVNGTGRFTNGVNLATSSGNVGIGTTSPGQKLDVLGLIRSGTTTFVAGGQIGAFGFGSPSYVGTLFSEISSNFEGANWFNGSNLIFKTSSSGDITANASVERMRITSGGNVLIGTTTDNGSRFQVNGGGSFAGTLYTTAGNGIIIGGTAFAFNPSSTRGCLHIAGSTDTVLSFGTNGNQDAYIYSASTLTQIVSTPEFKLVVGGLEGFKLATTGAATFTANINSFQSARFENTNNTSGNGVIVTALGSNCNNTSSYHLIAGTGGADKFYLYGNGTYTTVSDRRLKKNITTIQDTFLDKVLRLNIVNYQWSDQTDNDALELGMIAQEVEEIIPSIVHEGRPDENNDIYKGIQASVLPYILIKAIQEQQAQIEELKALINK